MKKMLLLTVLAIPSAVFAAETAELSEVSDGRDIGCFEESALPPAPDNVFVAEQPAPSNYSTVYITDKTVSFGEPTKIASGDWYSVRASSQKVAEAPALHGNPNAGDRSLIQVKAYAPSAYIPPAPTGKTASTDKEDVFASWQEDCAAQAGASADCKAGCCTPRQKKVSTRRGEDWFKSFTAPDLEKATVAAEKTKIVEVKETTRVVAVKQGVSVTTTTKTTVGLADEAEPELEIIVASPVDEVILTEVEMPPEPAIEEELSFNEEGELVTAKAPVKVDTSKAKAAPKKKVSLKKSPSSWKKSASKPAIASKASKTAKKQASKRPTITVEQIDLAIAKMIGSPNLNIRLEGINELGDYATRMSKAKERIEMALIVFLDGRASFEPCPKFENDPKVDVERALALLTKIHNHTKLIDLSNLNFSDIKIAGLDFTGFDLSDAGFARSTITNSNFSKATLAGSDFTGASITNSKFGGADIELSYFVKTNIKDSDFTGAKINCSMFKDAKIKNTKFDKAILTSAMFANAEIEGSSFEGANLHRADMNSTTLKSDNFASADLSGANLMKATFANTDFKDANLTGTYVKSTDMIGATGITVETMLTTVSNRYTKAPRNIASAFSNTFASDSENFNCSAQVCEIRLTGLTGTLDKLMETSLKVINNKDSSTGNNNWALCNISCIMHKDVAYGDEGLASVSEFIRRKASWPPKTNQQSISRIPTADVQAALYVIGHRPLALDGSPVNLTGTDLRGADFYGYNMTGVDFYGANLKGAVTGEATGLPANTQYTVFAR